MPARVARPAAGAALLVDIITGVRSAFTYVGAPDSREFYRRAVIGVQTSAGFYEGKPHGAVVGKPCDSSAAAP